MATKTVAQYVADIMAPVVAKIEAEFDAHAQTADTHAGDIVSIKARLDALEARFAGMDDEPAAAAPAAPAADVSAAASVDASASPAS